jgi:hypothetical protein
VQLLQALRGAHRHATVALNIQRRSPIAADFCMRAQRFPGISVRAVGGRSLARISNGGGSGGTQRGGGEYRSPPFRA